MSSLSKTARLQISAVSLPEIPVCTGSPFLQRCWTLSCSNLPVLLSRLCRFQSQTADHPIRRRCPPDTGRPRRLFFVPFAALGLFQCHGMDHTAFQQLQPYCVPRAVFRSTAERTLYAHQRGGRTLRKHGRHRVQHGCCRPCREPAHSGRRMVIPHLEKCL